MLNRKQIGVLFLGIIVGIFVFIPKVHVEIDEALGAPTYRQEQSIIPVNDSQFYIGTTSKAWAGGVFDELCLTLDSCVTTWAAGSGSKWTDAGAYLYPTGGKYVSFPYLVSTSTVTSTFAGGINIGDNHFITHGLYANAASGLHFHANNGTEIAMFGAGGSSGATFYGGLNVDGASRLATSLNGFGYLTNGAVTATTSGQSLTLSRVGNSTYSTIQDLQNIFHSAGWVSGGAISNAGGGNISVATGTGLIRHTNVATGTISYFDWIASSTINIPSNSYRYIGVEYNAGSPRIVSHTSYDWNFKTDFPLGNAVNISGIIHIETSPFAVGDHAANLIRREVETMPYQRDEMTGGLILGETGTRNVTVSAGAVWQGLTRFAISATSTATGGSFTTWAYNGTSWESTTSVTQWPNTQYNDITSGLVTMSAGKYANLWFYLETDGGLHMVYGRAQYNNLAAAEADPVPPTLPDKISVHSWLIGRIIFQTNAASASQIQSVYTQTFSATAATDHANLSNLAWTSSGHTGTASTIAGFNGSGVTSEYTTIGTAGSLLFSINPLLSGFRSTASSTIGGGTTQSGLTIYGGATTTGNAYFASNIGIGTTTPSRLLTVQGGDAWFGGNVTATGSLTVNAATSTVSFFSALGRFTNIIIDTLATFLNVTITGLLDIGGGSLEIPNGTNPTVDSIGETAFDSTANQFLVATSTAAPAVFPTVQYTRFTVASSTWGATTTVRFGGPAMQPIRLQGIDCVTNVGTLSLVVGSGVATSSVIAVTTATGTDAIGTAFTANEVPRFEIGTPASSPTSIGCTVQYVYDRQ